MGDDQPPAEAPPAPAEGEAAPEEAPADGEPKEGVEITPPCMDLTEYRLKIDHFDQMHALGDDKKVDGAPNYRQVAGFPVYGTAQPTEEGFLKVLDMIPKGTEEEPTKTIWYNMRQEPVIYINGTPYAPRDPERMHANLELTEPVPELDNLEVNFVDIVKKRIEDSGTNSIKIHKDSSYTENPMEREDVEETLKVESVKGLNELFPSLNENGFPNVQWMRVPVVEERAPLESCFDMIVDSLKNEAASTQCIFSCQMGRGRTTLGMIIACMVKEIQISTELKKMAEIGLVPQETITDLIKQKFESPLPRTQDDDDPFIKGEFDVIKELLEKVPESVDGKRKIDRVIDICGPSPKGTGLQNLRECIIETKWKYDVAPEEKQVVWKQMILNFMERYFYLICFGAYALEVGPTGFQSSFVEWMDKRAHLRTMIEEGKDKLEWYRQVDPAKLNTLKDLINAPNYKENLATLIRTIYEFAFLTYADLPRGPIKNNSMRKLAAKTLVEILPPDISQDIQKKLDEHNASPDFVTLIGLVSYHGKDAESA